MPVLRTLGLLLCLLVPLPAAADLLGEVVGITDGDTLTLLDGQRRQHRIRLAAIDCPESGQPYGNRAKQALADMAFGRAVRVVEVDTDRFGRVVGRVYVGRLDVNAEMVRAGAAWVFRRFSDDPTLIGLEAEAQRAGRGLWALPATERMPPWEWRSDHRRR